jgi:hypothetical protein
MSQLDPTVDGIKQAFEDFVAHEAEKAIAEATLHQEGHERLWVVLYGDGRFGTEHVTDTLSPTPQAVHGAAEIVPHIAFPIEPLRNDEWDRDHIENSRFERPIESLWTSFDQAINQQLHR